MRQDAWQGIEYTWGCAGIPDCAALLGSVVARVIGHAVVTLVPVQMLSGSTEVS